MHVKLDKFGTNISVIDSDSSDPSFFSDAGQMDHVDNGIFKSPNLTMLQTRTIFTRKDFCMVQTLFGPVLVGRGYRNVSVAVVIQHYTTISPEFIQKPSVGQQLRL